MYTTVLVYFSVVFKMVMCNTGENISIYTHFKFAKGEFLSVSLYYTFLPCC